MNDALDAATGSTSALSSDPARPSFFELIAQDQLRSLLSPAVRYTLSVLAQRYPRYLLRVFNRFDEVWALLMFGVERHYLRTWGASFAENFYMLRRRARPGLTGARLPPRRHKERLSEWQIYASLFFLVGLPYIQAKAHDWWERNGGGVDEDLFDDDGAQAEHDDGSSTGPRFTGSFDSTSSHATLRSRISSLLSSLKPRAVRAYPYASSWWHLFLLTYNVRYLFARTPFWRPWLSLLNLEIRRVAPGDYPASIPLLPPDLPNPLRSPRDFTFRMIRAGPYMAAESLKYLLPASIFAFKFLEWWYSSENTQRRGGGGGGSGQSSGGEGGITPRFGAPAVLMPSLKGVLYRREEGYKAPEVTVEMSDDNDGAAALLHNSCPLCGTTPMNNPALLPTGYAFCYTCANRYVEEHGRCPVTRMVLRDGTDGIRRVLG
ncbi:hypothetical protein BDZ90DRAFT_188854 [Jaminaea rosea]|uniref:Peroxisome assembly protein 12 n=1 Tax=Jaminaea rosea TaxID=1569628 RepID=A0A316UPL8_9BASI|nr:hypothetical protein BDZ90DRAFT_188854 [Jaminaea rosea]PWN27246.1 hypothetical protein BDZ90DRAFT_188854 [Jaminaea rosea]